MPKDTAATANRGGQNWNYLLSKAFGNKICIEKTEKTIKMVIFMNFSSSCSINNEPKLLLFFFTKRSQSKKSWGQSCREIRTDQINLRAQNWADVERPVKDVREMEELKLNQADQIRCQDGGGPINWKGNAGDGRDLGRREHHTFHLQGFWGVHDDHEAARNPGLEVSTEVSTRWRAGPLYAGPG